MGVVSAADLRSILRFLGRAAERATAAEPVPRETLAELGDLIAADVISYFELRRSDRAVLAYAADHDAPVAPGSDEAMLRFGHQNPLRWRNWTPADGPLRLSEVISRRALGRLEFDALYLRPNRIRDTLKIWLSSTPYSAACLQLDRSSREFDAHDAALLAVMQDHLADIRAAARRPAGLRDSSSPLTAREAQVVSWAVRGHRNEQIAARLFIAPATVQKHLERAYEKLGVRSRAEAAGLLTLGPLGASEPGGASNPGGGRP